MTRTAPRPRRRARRPGRVAIVVAAVAAVALLVTAGAVVLGVPRYRPALAEGQAHGIDVSHYQGRIDWQRVAGDDISYAYIKATEGATWVDPRFEENWAAVAETDVVRGAYHFFSLCSTGEEQLAHFLDVVPPDPDALAPAIDLEYSACTERPPAADLEREFTVFLDGIEAAWGRQVVLYVLPEFADRYPFLHDVDRPRWERSILRRPAGEWAVWQASNVARVEGIAGGVDLNVWRAPRADRSGRRPSRVTRHRHRHRCP